MVPPHGPEMDSHALSPCETSNPMHLQDWGAGYLAPWRQDQGMGYHHQSELHRRVDTMSRLLMRHEMELMALRVDTGFVMHLGAGPRGIIKQVMQASKEYYDAKTKQPRMQLTLKQTLLLAVFRILKERLAKLETENGSDRSRSQVGMDACLRRINGTTFAGYRRRRLWFRRIPFG